MDENHQEVIITSIKERSARGQIEGLNKKKLLKKKL